jgi:hypothetical protein
MIEPPPYDDPVVLLLQFTKKIPRETIGKPTINEGVNSSLRRTIPERTPKMGVKKVNADSLLTEY